MYIFVDVQIVLLTLSDYQVGSSCLKTIHRVVVCVLGTIDRLLSAYQK